MHRPCASMLPGLAVVALLAGCYDPPVEAVVTTRIEVAIPSGGVVDNRLHVDGAILPTRIEVFFEADPGASEGTLTFACGTPPLFTHTIDLATETSSEPYAFWDEDFPLFVHSCSLTASADAPAVVRGAVVVRATVHGRQSYRGHTPILVEWGGP